MDKRVTMSSRDNEIVVDEKKAKVCIDDDPYKVGKFLDLSNKKRD